MNKNSKNRKAGQFSQGNKVYLSVYQKSTRKCRKLMLDYFKAEYSIDSDEDKLVLLFESDPFIPQDHSTSSPPKLSHRRHNQSMDMDGIGAGG